MNSGRVKLHRRGSLSNPVGRFNTLASEFYHDGWDIPEDSITKETILLPEKITRIITSNDSPDIPHQFTINPYKGCEHGCIYCYARPTHAYNDLSSGIDFETKIFYKREAASFLKKEFANKKYKPTVLTIGSNTDPYQPSEKKLKITRSLLQVFLETKHPVALITKSALILRDLDILQELSRWRLIRIFISITSLNSDLAKLMEPRAATPQKRLNVVETLSSAGVPVGVMTAPIIPFLNDQEIESILKKVSELGAYTSGYVFIRLPFEVKHLFEEWLEKHFPLKKNHILNLIRNSRNGKLYDAKFGKRMTGEGSYADLLAKRYSLAKKKFNLNKRMPDYDFSLFQAPFSDFESQFSLF